MTIAKEFEKRFRDDWSETFPDTFVFRLNDQVSGMKEASKNPCDYICYNNGSLFLIECKSHKGASVPFSATPQYDRLLKYIDMRGVHAGVVCWLVEKDIVFYVSIKTLKQMKDDGEKSVGLRSLDKYPICVLESKKLRTYMKTDYSALVGLEE